MSPNTPTTGSTTQVQPVTLSQAEYHALVHGFNAALKFNPTTIVVNDSVIFTVAAGGNAVIQADYTPLIQQPVTMAFAPDKTAIKKMGAIRGAGDVRVDLAGGRYHFQGDHAGASLDAIPFPQPEYFALPTITWLGVEVSGYAPKDLKAFIGKKNDAVNLAVYDGQLEQLGIEGQGGYTFTAGMNTQLASRYPNLVLRSRVAFRYFGKKKQSIRLGQAGDSYILQVTNALDIGVDLVVFEQLDVVSASA